MYSLSLYITTCHARDGVSNTPEHSNHIYLPSSSLIGDTDPKPSCETWPTKHRPAPATEVGETHAVDGAPLALLLARRIARRP